MKKTLFCLSLLLCGAVHADDVANANALLAKKSYPQALQLLTKAANAGNADAQVRLAQLYAKGEAGVTADPAKADAWLAKAAAKGNKEAVAALERGKPSSAHRADIEYWTSKYDGEEFRSGEFRCPPPRFPAVSKQNDEIDAVTKRMVTWETCYNAAIKRLNAASPLTSRIPKEVADAMTKEEMAKATTYLAGVHAGLAEDAKVAAKLVVSDFTVWRDATDAYVAEHNRIVKENKAKGE